MKVIHFFIAFLSFHIAQAQMWGITPDGGTSSNGAVYKTNLDGTGFTLVSSFGIDAGGAFPDGGRMVKFSNGMLYGTTFGGGANNNGVIFEFNPSTGVY